MTMTNKPRIALVHAVTVAMDPVLSAFGADWPQAECVNLLDDSLSVDRSRATDITDAMFERFHALGRYAVSIDSDAILFTCSAFGPAIEAVARNLEIPVLKPNEAMFEAGIEAGTRIGMLATFGPSVAPMEAEFREAAAAAGVDAVLETVLVEDALVALKAGDASTHNRLLVEAAANLEHCDAVMLAHFSTSRALGDVSQTVTCPVLTAPGAAVAKLKRLLDRAD